VTITIREQHRRVLADSLWALASKVVTILLSMVINALLARRLTAEHMGVFLVLSSVAYFLGTVGTLGINSSLLRSLAARGPLVPIVPQAQAWRLVSFASVVLGIAACAVSMWVLPKGAGAIPLIALATGLWIPSVAATILVSDAFRGLGAIRLASLFDGTQGGLLPAAAAIVGILALPGEMFARLDVVLWTIVATTILNLLTGTFLLRHQASDSPIAEPDDSRPANTSGETVLQSLPFLGTALSLLLRMQAGLWIVGLCCGDADVAIFGIAQRAVNVIMLPLAVVTNSLQPTVAQLLSQNRLDDLERVLRRMAGLALLPALAATLVILFAGDRLLGEIFGSYYAAGGQTLKVLAIGNLLFTWGGCPGLVLSMGGQQRVNMVINLLTLLVIVAVGAALARLQGPIGMAYAMGAAGVINKGLSLWLVRKEFGISAEARLLPIRRIAAVRS
jgi:O-antigen/teichoic acid export membrane protein